MSFQIFIALVAAIAVLPIAAILASKNLLNGKRWINAALMVIYLILAAANAFELHRAAEAQWTSIIGLVFCSMLVAILYERSRKTADREQRL